MFESLKILLLNLPEPFWWMLFGVLTVLSLTTLIFQRWLKRYSAMLGGFHIRLQLWWIMLGVLLLCFILGKVFSLLLCAVLSFMALREFLTLTPMERADYWGMLLCFYVAIPLQYILIGTDWYSLFVIGLPVYAFIGIPSLLALSGNADHYFARNAKLQWALLLTVYSLSYAPAILHLNNIEYTGQGLMLMLYLLIVTQTGELFQDVVDRLIGKRKIAPNVNPSKTLEGFMVSTLFSVLIGMGLWWITPFSFLQAAFFSFIISLCGFFGGLSLSAVKRTLGAKDWGRMVSGQGGVMDRIDSLLFAAPVFFHMVRYTYF